MPLPLIASLLSLSVIALALLLILWMRRVIRRLQKQNLQLRKQVVRLRQQQSRILEQTSVKIHRRNWNHYELLTPSEFVESHSGTKNAIILN